MKKIAITLLVFIVTGNLTAQDYKHSLQGIIKVKIASESGIIAKTHSQNEVLIKGEGRKTPEKSRGLKAVYSGGSDNTGIGIYVHKEGETLIIRNPQRYA